MHYTHDDREDEIGIVEDVQKRKRILTNAHDSGHLGGRSERICTYGTNLHELMIM